MKPFKITLKLWKNVAAKLQRFRTRVKGFWRKNSSKMRAAVCAAGNKKAGRGALQC